MKWYGLSDGLGVELVFLSVGEVGGILVVGVKSVEIKRNTPCEGDLLEHN